MCDVQVLIRDGGVLFAKNSDREAGEPQVVERHAAANDGAATVACTYIDVPQTATRHAVVLSRPLWMWGAEMGVNERGVAIGNTAIFTKTATLEPALLGMDLLRLALERADDAEHAMQVIVEHLERFGQGGPCGYRDKGFKYDNAFLIADAQGAWQLETAGRHWAARRVRSHGAISNGMSIAADYDRISDGAPDLARRRGWWRGRGDFDFAAAFETRAMPVLSGARMRRRLSLACMAQATQADLATMSAHLRAHNPRLGRARHNHDVCMHAGGRWTRPSQSTAALVANLRTGGPRLAATGTSGTCRSLFRPVAFGERDWHVLTSPEASDAALWRAHESLGRRLALGLLDERAFAAERDALEARLWPLLADDDTAGLAAWDEDAAAWHGGWIERARRTPWRYRAFKATHRFWRWANRVDAIA